MALTTPQLLAIALADAPSSASVYVAPPLRALLPADAKVTSVPLDRADLALVVGEDARGTVEAIDDAGPPPSRIWSIVDAEPREGSLRPHAPAERRLAGRTYHPLALVEHTAEGSVVRRVVKGISARAAAEALGVPLMAGPDLAELEAPGSA